jgi:hypothetical protein
MSSLHAVNPACGMSLILIWNLKANLWQLFRGGDRLVSQAIAFCFPELTAPNSSSIAVANGVWC